MGTGPTDLEKVLSQSLRRALEGALDGVAKQFWGERQTTPSGLWSSSGMQEDRSGPWRGKH